LTKNQSKNFLNLSNQTIPTAPAIFPIKFNVLEVGGKISSQNKHCSYQNKNPQVKYQNRTLFMHYSLLEMTLFMRTATLFTLLHRQHTHYTKTHRNTTTINIYQLNHTWTKSTSKHQDINTNTLKFLLWIKLLVPGNDTKF